MNVRLGIIRMITVHSVSGVSHWTILIAERAILTVPIVRPVTSGMQMHVKRVPMVQRVMNIRP